MSTRLYIIYLPSSPAQNGQIVCRGPDSKITLRVTIASCLSACFKSLLDGLYRLQVAEQVCPILWLQILEQTIRHERTIARKSRDDVVGGQPYGGGSTSLDNEPIGRFENNNTRVNKSVAALNRRGSICRRDVAAGIDDGGEQVFFRHSSGDPS